MPLNVRCIRIKQSTYLLIPKTIAKMMDLSDDSEFELELKKNGDNTYVLQYKMNTE
ncbi:MAG: AbrB/MazE/SpoVT family DNA-binding domain-containing protein [Candidatus Lokiarchaeota archaeon]|nr:AbrB/MazE/SpoVT family DNA-binding domain-containing protein [Candidatus Lokiarchaeota archaeon]